MKNYFILFLCIILVFSEASVAQSDRGNYNNYSKIENEFQKNNVSPSEVVLKDVIKNIYSMEDRHRKSGVDISDELKFNVWFLQMTSKQINENFPSVASCNPSSQDVIRYEEFLSSIRPDRHNSNEFCDRMNASFVTKFGRDKPNPNFWYCQHASGSMFIALTGGLRKVQSNCKIQQKVDAMKLEQAKKLEEENARRIEKSNLAKQRELQEQKMMQNPIYRERKEKIRSCYSECQMKLESCVVQYKSAANQICGMPNHTCLQNCDNIN